MNDDASKRRKLIQIAMDNPDEFVAVIVYYSDKGIATERTISPINWDGPGKFTATCLCREALRVFYLGRVRRVRIQLASEVQPPIQIKRVKL